MPDIVKPELNELSYRRKLLKSKNTMQFNHSTVPFEKDQWEDWYEEWIEADPKEKFYRFVFCPGCNDFTCVMGYQKTDIGYTMELITGYDERGIGYGSFALAELGKAARENGIQELYAEVYFDNPYLSFLCKRGFEFVSSSEDKMLIKASTEILANGTVYANPCNCKK